MNGVEFARILQYWCHQIESSYIVGGLATLLNQGGKTEKYVHKYWRERAAFQRSAFGRSTAGNDVVATIFIRILARACGVPAVGVRAVDCWQ